MKPTLTIHTLPEFTITGTDRAYIIDVATPDDQWSSYVVPSNTRQQITLLGQIAGDSVILSVILSVRPLASPSVWTRLVGKLRPRRVVPT